MHFEVSKHTYFSLSLVRSNWRKPVFEGGPAFPCPRPHMFGKIHHPSQGSRSTVLLHKWQHCSPIAPFHFHCFDDNQIFQLAVFVLGLFPFDAVCFGALFKLWVERPGRTLYFPRQRHFQKNIIFELHWPKRPCTHKLCSKLKQFIIVFRSRLNFFSFHTFLREIVTLDHC